MEDWRRRWASRRVVPQFVPKIEGAKALIEERSRLGKLGKPRHEEDKEDSELAK